MHISSVDDFGSVYQGNQLAMPSSSMMSIEHLHKILQQHLWEAIWGYKIKTNHMVKNQHVISRCILVWRARNFRKELLPFKGKPFCFRVKKGRKQKNLLLVLVENLDLEILECFFAEKTKKNMRKTGVRYWREECWGVRYVAWIYPSPFVPGLYFQYIFRKEIPTSTFILVTSGHPGRRGVDRPHKATWHNRELVETPWHKLASNGVGHEENLGKIFLISSLRAPNKGHLSTDLHLKHQNKKIHSGKLTWNHKNGGLVQMIFLLKCSLSVNFRGGAHSHSFPWNLDLIWFRSEKNRVFLVFPLTSAVFHGN